MIKPEDLEAAYRQAMQGSDAPSEIILTDSAAVLFKMGVAQERERCAKIAEELRYHRTISLRLLARSIAERIRSGEEPEQLDEMNRVTLECLRGWNDREISPSTRHGSDFRERKIGSGE